MPRRNRSGVHNPVFARKVFGSVNDARGRYFKTRDGTCIQVVGLARGGKHTGLSGNQGPKLVSARTDVYRSVTAVQSRTQAGENGRSGSPGALLFFENS